MNIAFTGPRKVTLEQAQMVLGKLSELNAQSYHVGCASGVDQMVREYFYSATIYFAEGGQPWQLAARSKRMVNSCYKLGSAKLIAFPNKPCPNGVKRCSSFSGKGSGTWGTIAYAKHLGMDVELIFLGEFEKPDWMSQRQLTLF